VTRNVKVQALTAVGVDNVVLDLVGGDDLIAQIALISAPVPRLEGGREHDGQSALPEAPQDTEAQLALG
jgi:hypothetical protein